MDKLDEEIRAINDKITAAKACQSERAALLFAPVKMRRAGLKLYEPMKESGELRDVFKLTWDGRDYVRLSLSERVRCGLEVVELLSRLSGKSYPLFVDNTESLCDLGAAQHGGQMILARVVPRQTLQVKALDEPQRKACLLYTSGPPKPCHTGRSALRSAFGSPKCCKMCIRDSSIAYNPLQILS